MSQRDIDAAMIEDRQEKIYMRRTWSEIAERENQHHDHPDIPLFLTLSGAEGRDIEELIRKGIITVEENSAISDDDRFKVVAVENSAIAVLRLQQKFPGLKIYEHDYKNLVRGPTPFRWPDSEEYTRYCRAKVINLDLNEPLKPIDNEGHTEYPVLQIIEKYCRLHAQNPKIDWSLCLTLHGEIIWEAGISTSVGQFLVENFRDESFRQSCEEFLGDSLYQSVCALVDFSSLTNEEQQKILMVFVPKKLSRMICSSGWKLEIEKNLRYGGYDSVAPMVTWVINFRWDPRASSTPDLVYLESINSIMDQAGSISPEGNLNS